MRRQSLSCRIDLEPRRRKEKEDCNGIYIILRVESKHQAKDQIEESVKDTQKLWRRMIALNSFI